MPLGFEIGYVRETLPAQPPGSVNVLSLFNHPEIFDHPETGADKIEEPLRMRLICAAAMIAMLAGPAYAQSQLKGQPPQPPKAPMSQQEIEAERAADRAYKKSLGNIPDQPPADPWGIARGADAPKSAAKVPAKPAKTGGSAD
jgi:hypothetical protein